MADEIARKHTTQRIIGPEAPSNLNPMNSNLMSPVLLISRIITIHNARIAARGKPIAAAKWSCIISRNHGRYAIVTARQKKKMHAKRDEPPTMNQPKAARRSRLLDLKPSSPKKNRFLNGVRMLILFSYQN
jgi:hypothetical protein